MRRVTSSSTPTGLVEMELMVKGTELDYSSTPTELVEMELLDSF